MKSAVFFERDGILNLAKLERGHQASPLLLEEFQLNMAILEPLRKLKAAGFALLATTNQPGLSRGYQSRRELDRMHELLRKHFPIDDILVCPHDETDHCPCRKPQAGLLIEAAFKLHLDLERSYVISDKWQDAQAARIVGATSILIKSPWIGNGHHDFVVTDLSEVVEKIHQFHSGSVMLMHQI
jgi:D-glycero-D-manno-heptose 1,7-bisphosphate phosphatase